MKKGFKKLFNKKEKEQTPGIDPPLPQDGYITMDGNSLYNLPVSDLCEIIYKYDTEVKLLNQQLSAANEQVNQFKKDMPPLQDQVTLYKQHSENLQSELTKVESELTDTQTALEGRKAELDLTKSQLISKDELLSNYRKQVDDLQNQLSEINIESLSIPESSGNCCQDREKEILKLKTELSKLKTTLNDTHKLNQEVQELRITTKMLESEIAKMSMQNENYNNHIKSLNEKIASIDKAKQDVEIEGHKKQISIESMQREQTRMQFQKESLETEIRALKENLNQKEKKYNKKQSKLEVMQEQIGDKTNEAYKLKHEIETLKHNNQVEIFQLIENHRKEMSHQESCLKTKISELENVITQVRKGGEENGKQNEHALERLNTLELQNKEYNQELTRLNDFLKDQSAKVSGLEKENKQLHDNLIKANQKREAARQEVLKLSQRLDQKEKQVKTPPSPVKEESSFKLNSAEMTAVEYKSLFNFKNELETLYKMLMKLMMNGNATQDGCSFVYNITSEDFSTFERRLNHTVMQIHEALEDPEAHIQTAPSENSWSTRLNNAVSKVKKGMSERGPVKLFSCMSAQEESKGNMIPRTHQGRRLISNTGPRSATPAFDSQTRVGQRRGSTTGL